MRKTRTQLIKERRDEIILQLHKEGFLVDEIAKVFGLTNGRVSQILNKKIKKSR